MLELPECLQRGCQALALLVDIFELVGEEQQVAEKLHCELRIAVGVLTVGSQQGVQLILDGVPAFASLVERMHDCEAVERVVLEVSLAHALVGLASQRHVVGELAVLGQHEVLVGGLLEAHGLQYRLVSQLVCQAHKKVCRMPVLAKGLKQFSHHQAEADQALRGVSLGLAAGILLVDAVRRGNDVLHVILRVKLLVCHPRVEP